MKQNVYIHETSDVDPEVPIGNGTKIWHQAQVRRGASIGSECVVGKGVYIAGTTTIGSKVKIQNYANIFGGLVEDNVILGPMAIVVHDNFPRATNKDGSLMGANQYKSSYAHLKYGCSIGAGAIILPGVVIGKFAMVGAGSVIRRDVKDFALVLGNPSRQVGSVCMCGHMLPASLTCEVCQRTYKVTSGGIDIANS